MKLIPLAGSAPPEIASIVGRPAIVVEINSCKCGARVRPVLVVVLSSAALTYIRLSSLPIAALMLCSR